jgi:hypothetical protein
MRTRITGERKNLLQQHLLQSANTFLQTSDLLAPSEHKKITARCSTTVQFEKGAAIFKEIRDQRQNQLNLALTAAAMPSM